MNWLYRYWFDLLVGLAMLFGVVILLGSWVRATL